MDTDIVHTAIENLLITTDNQGVWNKKGPLDGVLQLTINNKNYAFNVKIKQEARMHQLAKLKEDKKLHGNLLLVANRLFPKIKEELRQLEIAYLEANGNIFIKKEELFLFIDTQKPISQVKNQGNRAFTKTGLKVLFYLLQNKEAINFTQRELAEKAGVGLGNIPQIISGLKETGYLITLNGKTYIWENRPQLLERWIAEYATVLRPKLVKERYAIMSDWRKIKLESNKTYWGGEPAADLLTNHLRPEKFLLYTMENRMDLIKNYGIMPDDSGELEVLEMFWKSEKGETVPPLLVYADLLLEGGKRNKETAEKIYNEYIKPNL